MIIILIGLVAFILLVLFFALAIMRGSAQEQAAYDQAYAAYVAKKNKRSGLG